MKLSEMSTDRAADVLCEISVPAMHILSDGELMEELKSAVNVNGANTLIEKMAIIGEKISKIMPILLKKRKNDLFSILGSLNEKTTEEIAKQNIIKTMGQIRDITKDRDLLDFFKSCTDMEESE